MKQVQESFQAFLGLATEEQPIVLVLDSLDQLNDTDNPKGKISVHHS